MYHRVGASVGGEERKKFDELCFFPLIDAPEEEIG